MIFLYVEMPPEGGGEVGEVGYLKKQIIVPLQLS